MYINVNIIVGHVYAKIHRPIMCVVFMCKCHGTRQRKHSPSLLMRVIITFNLFFLMLTIGLLGKKIIILCHIFYAFFMIKKT